MVMKFIQSDGSGGFKTVEKTYEQMVEDWFAIKPEPCVVCGGLTRTAFWNKEDGRWDRVHNYGEEGLDCKIVWRHRKDLVYKKTREEWVDHFIAQGSGAYAIDDLPQDLILKQDDTWHDYDSYIASHEWRIKSRAAKNRAGGKCARCGQGGSYSELHTHHKHYRTLYKERPEDVEVLCAPCHRAEHGLEGNDG